PAHVAVQFRPTDPREIIGQRGRDLECLARERQTGPADRFVGEKSAAPVGEFHGVARRWKIGEPVTQIAGEVENPSKKTGKSGDELQPRNVAKTRIATKQFI